MGRATNNTAMKSFVISTDETLFVVYRAPAPVCAQIGGVCVYTHGAGSGDGSPANAAGCGSARARFISKCHFQIS